MTSFCPLFVVCFLLAVTKIPISVADPDPLQDFCVADTSSPSIFGNGFPCLNPTKVRPKHFTTSAIGIPGNTSNRLGLSLTTTGPQNLPGSNTLGLTYSRLDVAVGGLVPPHVHPRASEMVFIAKGKFNVGFVDASNKLFSTDVKAGDLFLIPRGLVHYQLNIGRTPGLILATLNSQNPGFVFVQQATFDTKPALPTAVLSKAFNISPREVKKIEHGLAGN